MDIRLIRVSQKCIFQQSSILWWKIIQSWTKYKKFQWNATLPTAVNYVVQAGWAMPSTYLCNEAILCNFTWPFWILSTVWYISVIKGCNLVGICFNNHLVVIFYFQEMGIHFSKWTSLRLPSFSSGFKYLYILLKLMLHLWLDCGQRKNKQKSMAHIIKTLQAICVISYNGKLHRIDILRTYIRPLK